jgi:hypothetical protein
MGVNKSPQCSRGNVAECGRAWRGVQRGGGAGITELPLPLMLPLNHWGGFLNIVDEHES